MTVSAKVASKSCSGADIEKKSVGLSKPEITATRLDLELKAAPVGRGRSC